METLDVTQIEPRLKHPTIFEKFDGLASGSSFIIHNDHDPKPLYYQLIAERGQTFDWEYLVSGPQVWEVKISKLQTGETPSTIGELVANDFRKAEVFRKFGLDFCCGGHKSVKDACSEKGIDVLKVEQALAAVDSTASNKNQDFNNWELDFLIDFILNTHHKYVADSIPMLYEYTAKVASVHGHSHPEVIEVAQLFKAVAEELESHMHKEEVILFPFIKKLILAKKNDIPYRAPGFGSIQNPINVMETEHESAGDSLKRMSEITDGFTPPDDACSTYRVLYAKLKEFESDLFQHIHLENNILFPKAIAVEKSLIG